MNLKRKLTDKRLLFSVVLVFFLFISLTMLNDKTNTNKTKILEESQSSIITSCDDKNVITNQIDKVFIKTSAALEAHDPILIVGDGDFTGGNGVRDGDGSEGNPYIISDYEITDHTATWGIQIINTSLYFKIINCSISYMQNGIQFDNVTNGIITNNTITSLVGEVGGEGATGESSTGIDLVNVRRLNTIEYNVLYNLTAGDGGDSGGADGGNSGFVYPIYVRDSSANNTINENIIYDIYGGNGGLGGNGAGGDAYPIYGIIVVAENNTIFNNTIHDLYGGNGGDGTTTGGNCQGISALITNEDADNSVIYSNYVYNVLGGNGGTGTSGNGGTGAGINIFEIGESQIAYNLTCYNITSGNGGTSSGANSGNGGTMAAFYFTDDVIDLQNSTAELLTSGTGTTNGLTIGLYSSGQLNLTFSNINITSVNSSGDFHGYLAYSSGNIVANISGSLRLTGCNSSGTENIASFVGTDVQDIALAIETDRNQMITSSEAALFNDIFVIIQNNSLINARTTTLTIYEYNITDITNQSLYYSVSGGDWEQVNINDSSTYTFPEAANNSITTYYVENEIGSVLITGKLTFQIYFAALPEPTTPPYDKGGDNTVTEEELFVITVTVLRNGIPQEGVWVELSDGQENYIFKLKTNSNGTVEFREMRKGTYSVKPLFGEKGVSETSAYTYSRSGLRFDLVEDHEITINISNTSPIQDFGRFFYDLFFGEQLNAIITITTSIGLNAALIFFTMKPKIPKIMGLNSKFKRNPLNCEECRKKISVGLITALNAMILIVASLNVFSPLEIETPLFCYAIGYSMIILLAVGVITGLYALFIIIALSTSLWAFIPLTMFYFVLYVASMTFVIVLILLLMKQKKKRFL